MHKQHFNTWHKN